MSLHIVSKHYEGIGDGFGGGRGRNVVYTLSNEEEYLLGDLVDQIGISPSQLHYRIRRYGIDNPKVLLTKAGESVDIGLPRATPGFDRTKYCIRNRINCVRYSECLEDRLLQGEEWIKPDGDCYAAESERYRTRFSQPYGGRVFDHSPSI